LVTLIEPWAAPAAIPLPAVLAGGAGAVIATAAALSSRAARRPDLPAQRWSRPLPAALCRVVDAQATRMVLRGLGLVAAIAGGAVLAGRDAPADGFIVVPVVTAAAVIAGPVYRMLDPVRTLHAARSGSSIDHLAARDTPVTPHGPATPYDDATNLRGATVGLIVLSAIALSTHDPTILAATVAAVLLQSVLPGGLQRDPFGALAGLLGHLAPLGRDPGGRLVWRNPLVTVAHAPMPPGALAFGGVVIAASLTHTSRPIASGFAPAGALLVFGATLAVVVVVLRIGVVRPFLRSAIVPVVAAYGVVAGGRWLPPVDLLLFVALHVVAVWVLHRQAVARHDLRMARAVQFPARVALIVSVLSGLTLLAAS
jgi:hypothetical protein